VAIVALATALCAAVLLVGLTRLASREADRTMRVVTSSPWADIETVPARRAHIVALLALEDEMLVELEWEPNAKVESEGRMDLVGPSSIAAIVTLSRWRDARSTVNVHELRGRYLLRTPQSRLALRASPVSGRAPMT